jgi:hypothetical protein
VLVAYAFGLFDQYLTDHDLYGSYEDFGFDINHKNYLSRDNRLYNLEIVSSKENLLHRDFKARVLEEAVILNYLSISAIEAEKLSLALNCILQTVDNLADGKYNEIHDACGSAKVVYEGDHAVGHFTSHSGGYSVDYEVGVVL